MNQWIAGAVTALACLLTPSVALAEPWTAPVGYAFCGWKDFSIPHDTLSWTFDPEQVDGATIAAYARNMTCLQATRNIDRVKLKKNAPYAPYLRGYNCQRIENAWEYSDVRCIKRGKKAAFRYQVGS